MNSVRNTGRSTLRSAALSAYALVVALAFAVPAWAQAAAPEPPKPNWVMSYVLIVVFGGLGIFMVCRGTKRQK